MEQDQELRALDKSIMAAKLDESGNNEPEAWYKVVHVDGVEEVAESPLHSEDEMNLSHGRSLVKPTLGSKSLTLNQTMVQQQYHEHMPLKRPP